MRVSEIMTHPVYVAREETTLAEIAQLMLQHRIWGVPIVNQAGRICGIVTQSDFLAKEKNIPFSRVRAPQLFGTWLGGEKIEHLYQAAQTMQAREIMSTRVVTATEDESIEDVVLKMLRHDITRVPVVRDDIPVGMVARHDLLKLLARTPAPTQPVTQGSLTGPSAESE